MTLEMTLAKQVHDLRKDRTDLLEVLTDLLAWHDGNKTYCNWIKAREVISKIAGETK